MFQGTHVNYPCKSLAILPDFCRVADAVDSVSATMLQLLLFRLSANGWKCFADLLRKFEHDIGHLPTAFLFFDGHYCPQMIPEDDLGWKDTSHQEAQRRRTTVTTP